MATVEFLRNERAAASEAIAGKKAAAMASSTSGGSGTGAASSSSDSTTISANDFLTLLVTEMQNQDPTSTTDPNEYINQLVEVNSLEQLITINQTLTTDLGSSSSASGSGTSTPAAGVTTPAQGAGATLTTGARSLASHSASPGAALPAAQARTIPRSAGNLGIPEASPAAEQVAHALAGRS